MPAGVLYAERERDVELIWAAVAIPFAVAFGMLAIALGRRGARTAELRLRGRTGAAPSRLGRILGLLALILAGTALIALGWYEVLVRRD